MTPETDKHGKALQSALASTLKAMTAAATHANIRNYQAAKKALEEYQTKDEAAERFKNIEQAANWIISQGYIVSPRTIRNHTDRPGFPKRQKDGSYLLSEIATYAAANWENPGKPPADPVAANSSSRDDLLAEQVRKLRLANDITEGNYILRSLVEQEFAARASYLKRDLFNLGPRFIDRQMDKLSSLLKDLGVNIEEVNIHSLVPDLEAFWDRKIAEHLNEYSKARGFIPEKPQGTDE